MRRLIASFLLLLALLLWPTSPGTAHADEDERAIRLMESMALTPDGSVVVFSWRGDLWRVAAAGGPARRLTFHPGRDIRPHVSPDGTQVAFVSDRTGVEQVHVMPLAGGRPRQVTLHSEGARVYGWFPDGRALLTRSARDHHWRQAERLFRKPLDLEAPPELLFDAEAGWASVSPDGNWIAFTRGRSAWYRKGYRGPSASRIWMYSLAQKTFTRLSEGEHGELWPMWAGGKLLYYVSEEDGTWNLWRRDVASGEKVQLTDFEGDGVSYPSISADRSAIVFRRLFDTYVMQRSGKITTVRARDVGDPTVETTERRTVGRAQAAAFTDDAREIAIVAGGDLWVMDTELREPRRVTRTAAEEKEPFFSRDFQSLYFVSEAGDHPDLWRARRADESRFWWQNDEFIVQRLTDDEAVESDVRLTPDGKRIAYQRGTDLWTCDLDGKDARRHVQSFSGLDYSFSPDGRWIAYSKPDDDFNWDVWITPVDGSREPFNVSRHPDNDGHPAWSPDGSKLAFAGRRWTQETDVCYVWLRKEDDETNDRDRTLEKALAKMKGRKKKAAAGKQPPTKPASPAEPAAPATADPLAGTWRGRITGEDPVPKDGLDLVLTITRDKDGAYTCALEVVGQFSGTADALTFDAATGAFTFKATTPLGLLTSSGTVAGNRLDGTWSIPEMMSGALEATRDAPAPAAGEASEETPEQGAEAKDPKKEEKPSEGPPPLEIDFDGLEDRIRRIEIPDSDEEGLFWSHDGKKLAFRAVVGGRRGLYTVQFPDELKPKFLTAASGERPRWLKEGNQIAWLSGGLPATLSASGKASSLRFEVRQEVDLPDLHAAAFDQAWRTMRDAFYDPALGGRDWNAVRAKYAPMAARCATGDELQTVVNMMLGELNASHLGYRSTVRGWTRPGWRDVTGHLGCRFEPAWDGEGLKVRDVVPGSPADEARHRILAGEVVLSIDGRPVNAATNLTRVMTGDPERSVEVVVQNAEGGERTLRMRPTTFATVRRRLYDHWIEQTRARIEKASQGRLGYLHIRSMNWSSFLRFEAELYKVGFGKDGLIIDVRDNGGGFTTDHLLTCLTQPRHAFTVPRRGGVGYPHDRMVYAPWTKPVVVLCNENSFSNAEIFAHAIRTLGRGPVVGVQTAGGVISTGGTRIMGIGSLRLPFRGWFLLDSGEDMELNGCVPDHVVWPRPGDLAAGIDRQADKAVEVGLAEIEAWKRRPRPEPRYRSQR